MGNTNESKKIVTASEIARHGYEASVMNRMQGRSGAYTKTGSKGIALEIMGTDQINVRNMANPDVSAALTKKANAPQVDVVVMNQNKVSERLQFKDVVSDTGVGNVIKRTKNGGYRSAQMYGTTESAQKFNQAAEKAGLNKRMVDTGISSKTTERIGNNFTNHVTNAANIEHLVKETTKSAAMITAGFEVAKGIVEGKSAGETANSVVKNTAKNSLSTMLSVGASEIATNILVMANPTIGMPVKTATKILTTIGVGTMVDNVTDGVFDDLGDCVENAVNGISDAISDFGFDLQCSLGGLFGWL